MNTADLQFATDLAREAGAIMKKYFGLDTPTEWKADNSPITIADTTINQLVIDRVKATYPNDSIIGEEGSFVVEGSPRAWVCDPIDGTLPYSVGIPISTFSLALVENGVPIVGVIYDPFCDRLYTAKQGEGTFLNEKPIQVSDQKTLFHSHVSNESSLHSTIRDFLRAEKVKVTHFHCVTCPGVLVAAGTYEGVICNGVHPWDFAALKIIVEEAGGKVTDLQGNEQRYDQAINGAVVSNGILHEKLLEIIQKVI